MLWIERFLVYEWINKKLAKEELMFAEYYRWCVFKYTNFSNIHLVNERKTTIPYSQELILSGTDNHDFLSKWEVKRSD